MRYEAWVEHGIRQMVAHPEPGDLIAAVELTRLRRSPVPLRTPVVYGGQASVELLDRAERDMFVAFAVFDSPDGRQWRPLTIGDAYEVRRGESFHVTTLGRLA